MRGAAGETEQAAGRRTGACGRALPSKHLNMHLILCHEIAPGALNSAQKHVLCGVRPQLHADDLVGVHHEVLEGLRAGNRAIKRSRGAHKGVRLYAGGKGGRRG